MIYFVLVSKLLRQEDVFIFVRPSEIRPPTAEHLANDLVVLVRKLLQQGVCR